MSELFLHPARRLRQRRAAIAALACVLVLGAASPASADPTAAEKETARTLLISGREKRKAGKLKDALADFERAHGIMKVPTTGLDLGKVQEALGLLVEARTTLLEVARLPSTSDEPRAFKRAREEAKSLADAISPRLSTLTVSAPAGAKVKIDGAEISASSVGAPLKVNPGKHEIEGAVSGDEKHTSVDLAEGESRSVQLALAGAPVAEKPDKPPPPKDKDKDKDQDTTDTKTNPLVWVGLAATGVGLAVGTTTGLMAFSAKDDVAKNCTRGQTGNLLCPPETHPEIDRGTMLATVSTVSFVVAALGGGLLVYGLLNPKQVTPAPATSGLRIVPTPTGFAGVF